jgi:chemotaxis protein MotB
MREIGKALNDVPNAISISGHTDAQAYAGSGKGYSNWELSADRANAARRELIAGGLVEERFRRVVGLSSAVLFDSANPLNPINRRISIIVMNKKTEEEVSKDGGTIEAEAKEQPTGEQSTGEKPTGENTDAPASKH